MIKVIFIILLSCATITALSQPGVYTVSNAHSHNDYEQRIPFWSAYNAGFGSIEADIFLVDSVLYVAHDSIELRKRVRLENEYLNPLILCLEKNSRRPYADKQKKLQMLIDIKTDSINTLNALIRLLQKYPHLIESGSLSWVITGNRPDASLFTSYPAYIVFDGEAHRDYSTTALSKIVMMSDDFKNYSLWDGKNQIPVSDSLIVTEAVNKAHHLKKAIRFWDAPDQPNAWNGFMHLRVDYINTDHIAELSAFLSK